jgi:hypothetical protein
MGAGSVEEPPPPRLAFVGPGSVLLFSLAQARKTKEAQARVTRFIVFDLS